MSVDDVKAKVQRILTEEFGTVSIDRDGDFSVTYGSAMAFITFADLEQFVVVEIAAYVLSDVPVTPELLRYAALEGGHVFGHMSVLVDDGGDTGTLVFSHTLLGDFLDKDELLLALEWVAGTADDVDDELQAQFGGTVFLSE